jgi:LacI family transcriptional regulator
MPTIREVAEKAGVSFTTVSHVINKTRFVSEETRERVLAAMNELNYRPNALAQSLRSGKTNTIGLILPDSANPFFAEVGRCIEAEAFRMGYSVILCNTEGDSQKEQFYVDVLSKKQVDGVIFVSTGDGEDSLDFLIGQAMPLVVVDRDFPNKDVDAVLTDNRAGGYLATRHLIEMGHKRIAYIRGPFKLTPSAERVTGYQQALQEAGISIIPDLILHGDSHSESGRIATRILLERPEPPSAIFVWNDMMAVGALRAAADAGCKVPEDVAVVGYDDIDLASYTNPPLTSIAQPKAEIGLRAVRLLTERMADYSLPTRREVLPVKLIIRQSSHPGS